MTRSPAQHRAAVELLNQIHALPQGSERQRFTAAWAVEFGESDEHANAMRRTADLLASTRRTPEVTE